MITKENLKHEIEELDDNCLDLVYRLLQQFPHQPQKKPDLIAHSRPIDDTNDAIQFVQTFVQDNSSFGDALTWQKSERQERSLD